MTPKTASELAKHDKKMAKLIKQLGPITIKPKGRQSPYESLFRSVVYQQLTGKAASTILGRVKDLYPQSKTPTPEQLLKTKDAKLRAAGLSGAKTKALKDLAQKTLDGIVPTTAQIKKMSDLEIIERLIQIRGIGQWTIEMMLIFKLGRPDVFPATDYAIRKGFAKLHGLAELPKPKVLLEHSLKWQPYRSTAAWYLWRSLD